MKLRTTCISGFTLLEIMIVVAIIGLLLALAVPQAIRQRNTSAKATCIHNLRQISDAKERWAIETKVPDGEPVVDSELETYFKRNVRPLCPLNGDYTFEDIGIPPICSKGPTHGHTL